MGSGPLMHLTLIVNSRKRFYASNFSRWKKPAWLNGELNTVGGQIPINDV